MRQLFFGYSLAIGLWVGSIFFVMLALTGADTLPEYQWRIGILILAFGIAFIVVPTFLLVWSIRSIKNGTMSKAGIGIPVITGLFVLFLVLFVGRGYIGTTIRENRLIQEHKKMQEEKWRVYLEQGPSM